MPHTKSDVALWTIGVVGANRSLDPMSSSA
jgi:hypothetical protein